MKPLLMLQASTLPLIGPLSYDQLCAKAGIAASARQRMVSEAIRILKVRTPFWIQFSHKRLVTGMPAFELSPRPLFQLTGRRFSCALTAKNLLPHSQNRTLLLIGCNLAASVT